jgi:hypothetical protein
MKWLLLLTPINTRFELCNHVVARVGFFVVVVIVAITRSTWILLALLDTFGLRTFGLWPAGASGKIPYRSASPPQGFRRA